jgi:hypothetical protein
MESAESEAVLNAAFVVVQCSGALERWERRRNLRRISSVTIRLHARDSSGRMDTSSGEVNGEQSRQPQETTERAA